MSNEFDIRNSYALLIGVGTYIDPRFSNLPATIADVKAIEHVLTDPSLCAYNPLNVKTITTTKATASNIRNEFNRLLERCNRNSTVFFYFSGHGGRLKKNSEEWHAFLCPTDVQLESVNSTAISDMELTNLLASLPAQKILILLDACHSGGVVNLKSADYPWKDGLPSEFLQKLANGIGKVAIASSKTDQYSYVRKEGDLSVFTYYFLKALKGEAAVRQDGYIHVLDVIHYVTEMVPKEQPKQQPMFSIKDADSNFPIALEKGGKNIYSERIHKQYPLVLGQIREEIVESPINGAKHLSEYIKTKPEFRDYVSQLDLKRSELQTIQRQIDLFGPSDNDKGSLNRAIFFILKICTEIENQTVE